MMINKNENIAKTFAKNELYVQLYKHTFVEMIFLHPIAAATRVKAPILSGVRTLSKITVIGAELSFGFSLIFNDF